MNLTTTSISYQLDPNKGTTTMVVVGLRGTTDNINGSFTVNLSPSDLAAGQTLDDLNRKELSDIAAKKIPLTVSGFTDFTYTASVKDGHIGRIDSIATRQDGSGTFINLSMTLTKDDLDLDTATMDTVKAAMLKVIGIEFK